MSKILKKYRTYFDKNNTIILNSLVNTAHNPTAQITNGESCSRFLFYCDFAELKEKYANGDLNPDLCTHKIYLKNTISFDVSQIFEQNSETYDGNVRAYSTDLELHLVDEFWDSGVGYDYYRLISDTADERNFVFGPSNWKYRTTDDQWTTEGAITSGSEALSVSHLNEGDEDLVFDATDIINKIIKNESLTDYTEKDYQGFAIKYPDGVEINSNGYTKYLGVFSKYTQSFFEPYIETTQSIEIFDDRRNFYKDKDNYLYFYVNIGGNLTDLDDIPTVTIPNGPEYEYVVERAAKGIYRVQVPSTIELTPMTMYYDIWDNLVYNGKTLSSVTLDFVPKPTEQYFDLGLINNATDDLYAISLSGIKVDERIKGGDVRTVKASIRKPYTPNIIENHYDIYYTLYIKQGTNRVTVIDWQKLDMLYSGYEFTVDTSWLIPQQYFIDIRVDTSNSIRMFNEEIKFNIIGDFNNKIKE